MNNQFADMPEEQNPYASPAEYVTTIVVPGDFDLLGQQIVGPSPIVLPEVCVRCGEDAEAGKRLKRTLTWAPPIILILLLLGPLLLLIVSLVVQKKVKVEYSLCETCARSRWSKVVAVWILIVIMLICFLLAASLESVILAIVGILLFIGALIFAVLSSALITAKKYQDPVFYLGGAKPAFFEAMALRETTNDQVIMAEESTL